MNRPISRRMHGMLDYPAGLLLIAAPWIFGFSDVGGAAVAVPIVIGAVVLLQSVMTDYEFGLAKVIPMRGHLTMDVLVGAVLAVSPFVFGFSDEGTNAWLPHVVAGLGLIAAGAMTDPERASGSPVHERGPYTASR
jgi:SPW repeat